MGNYPVEESRGDAQTGFVNSSYGMRLRSDQIHVFFIWDEPNVRLGDEIHHMVPEEPRTGVMKSPTFYVPCISLNKKRQGTFLVSLKYDNSLLKKYNCISR